MNPNRPQPTPVPNGSTPVWDLVMKDMAERNLEGIRKYGTPLQVGNGRDGLLDAYQEALDLCVYLRLLIEERKLQNHAPVVPGRPACPPPDGRGNC